MKRDDAGVTLVEVLICVAIMGIIFAALTTAFFASTKSITSSSARMANSHDSQIAESFFQSDMQSATSVSTSDTSCGGSTPLISFTWFGWDTSTVPPTQIKNVASYRVISPSPPDNERQLVRQLCTGTTGNNLSSPSTLVVAHNLPISPAPAPTAVCSAANDPSTGSMLNSNCNGTPEVALVTATAKTQNVDTVTADQTALVYVLQASRRPT